MRGQVHLALRVTVDNLRVAQGVDVAYVRGLVDEAADQLACVLKAGVKLG